MADATAIVNATGGTGLYQYRFDSENLWGYSNARTGLAAGGHTVYVRDLMMEGCFTNKLFNIGSVVNKWQQPVVRRVDVTANSITITIVNPNIGGHIRADASESNVDLNDDTGQFWKWGADIAGPATAGTEQTITISDKKAGTLYYLRLLAWGEGKANADWVYGGGVKTASAGTAINTPTNVQVTLAGYVPTITWDDNSTGHYGYEVRMQPNGGQWQSLSEFIGASERSYTGPSLQPNGTYLFSVRTKSSTIDSPWSANATATTSSNALTAPQLTASLSGTMASLSWVNSQEVQYYQIERTVGNEPATIIENAWDGFSRWYVDSPIAENIVYKYRVRSKSGIPQKLGPWSNYAQVYKPGSTTGIGASGNNSASLDNLAWLPTQAQVDANNYIPPFSQKHWTVEESPFWSPLLNPPLGKEIGKPSRYDMGFGTMQSFGSTEADLFAAVAKANRFNEVPQTGTLGPMGGTELLTDNPINIGQTFNTAFGTVTVTEEDAKYDYFKANLANAPGGNANYGVIRYDIEEHRDYAWSNVWIKGRYCWQGGKFLPASAGGTDPYWSTKTDQFWYDAFLDQVTKVMVTMVKKTKDGTGALVTGYAQYANPGNPIWNRQVTIDGVLQPKLSELVDLTNVNDMIVGYFAFKPQLGNAVDNGKWFPIAYAAVPMTGQTVSAKPSRFRAIQLNDLNSLRPQLKIRFEDENGNLAKSPDGIALRFSVAYASTTQPVVTESFILRSENDQVPEQIVTLANDVDLTFWKRASNLQYTFDRGIAEVLVRSHNDRSTYGKMVIQQQYTEVNWLCCERFGTCPQGGAAMGQCEVNYSAPLNHNFTTATALFRGVEKIKTAWWADGVDVQNGTIDKEATYRGAATYHSIASLYKALDTYGRYRQFFIGNAYSIPFEISFDGGATWKTHAQYLSSLTWSSTAGEPSVDNKTAAIKVVWNNDTHKVLIMGTPLYTDQITPLIRYQIEGYNQVTKSLPLRKSYEDGFYMEWYTQN